MKTNKTFWYSLSILLTGMLLTGKLYAQVRIGEAVSPTQGAVLDLSSSSSGYVGGLKLPNVSLTGLTIIPATFKEIPADKTTLKGMIVYNTNTNATANIFPGIYYWDGAKWVLQVTTGDGAGANSTDAWRTTGNKGTNTTDNFIGTTDNQSLMFKVNNTPAGRISSTSSGPTSYGYNALVSTTGMFNTAVGSFALNSNTTGNYNNALGYNALTKNTTGLENNALGTSVLYSNTTGRSNNAIGTSALYYNTEGGFNCAVGASALFNNTTGNYNNAFGYRALYSNTTACFNNAFGTDALNQNTTGTNNVAFGYNALYYNTTASSNSAFGYNALYNNTIGENNIAVGNALVMNTTGSNNNAFGNRALYGNTTASNNSAFGTAALNQNTTGTNNVALGNNALFRNTMGYANTAVGYSALYNTTGNYNCAFGDSALYACGLGSENVAIGYKAGSNLTSPGSNNVIIGSKVLAPTAGSSNTITIGVNGSTMASQAIIYATGGWTTGSDRRMKHNILPIGQGLSFVMKLKPSEFIYNTDESSKKSLGFIAQEVQETMAAENMNGNDYHLVQEIGEDMLGLTTTELIPVLTKAVQEQQTMIEAQQKIIEQLEARLKVLENAK